MSMRNHRIFAGVIVFWSVLAAALPAKAEELTVVELFTSQSCPNAPKGDKNLTALAEEPGVLALSYPVTYWNYLGWKDTLSRSEFDERQRAYLKVMPDQFLYTPQAVVDGRLGVNGENMDEVRSGIAKAQSTSKQKLQASGRGDETTLTLSGAALTAEAVVTFVAWEPGITTVKVTGGKNRGKTLDYANVVRGVYSLGRLNAGSNSIAVTPPADTGGACAYLLQDAATMEILAVTRCV